MKETSNNWPGVFGGKRVPFDPKVIFLGFLAILIFMGGIHVIQLFAEEPYLASRTFSYAFRSLGPTAEKGFNAIYSIFPCMKADKELLLKTPDVRAMIALSLWSVFIFFFFGAAISRIIAIGIAKDDSLSISQALRFAWKHKFSLFLAPFLAAFFVAFFYGCNWLAGFLAQYWSSIGPILFIFVFFLILLSTFFIICLFLGLFCGIHLLPAAISTEGCDGFEAGISVFCYIFYRPWSYILHNTFLVISVVLLVWLGGIFLDLSFQSSLVSVKDDINSYHFDKSWTTVRINYKSLKGQEAPVFYIDRDLYGKESQNFEKRFQEANEAEKKALESKRPKMYQASMDDVWSYIQGRMVDSWVYDKKSNETIQKEHTMTVEDFWRLDKYWACIAGILGFFYLVIQYGILGYAFAYIFAAGTTIYFLLRKEIDGTDFDEIWEVEAEEKFVKNLESIQKNIIIETPKVEPPKIELPVAEAPKAEPSKIEVPVAEAPKAELPKAEVPIVDAPKAEVPVVESPKAELPKAEVPVVESPKAELPKESKKDLKGILPKHEVKKEPRGKTFKTEVKEEPKTEVKEEPKAEVKEEPKTEVKEEPKTEVKDEPKTEVKEEPKTEVKEESKTEVKEEPKTEVKEESKTEVKEEPKTEVKEEPKTEVKEEPKTEVKEESKTELPKIQIPKIDFKSRLEKTKALAKEQDKAQPFLDAPEKQATFEEPKKEEQEEEFVFEADRTKKEEAQETKPEEQEEKKAKHEFVDTKKNPVVKIDNIEEEKKEEVKEENAEVPSSEPTSETGNEPKKSTKYDSSTMTIPLMKRPAPKLKKKTEETHSEEEEKKFMD